MGPCTRWSSRATALADSPLGFFENKMALTRALILSPRDYPRAVLDRWLALVCHQMSQRCTFDFLACNMTIHRPALAHSSISRCGL